MADGRHERPSRLVNLVGIVSIGALQMGVTISLAALIFSDNLAAGAGRAIAGFLLGSAIVSIVVGWFSKLPIVIAAAQDTTALVVASVAASVAASSTIDAETAVATALVLTALSTLVTGLVFWFIGRRGLTGLIRYLPWPVLTGFTAGTGYLLVVGGVEVMRGSAIEFSALGDLAEWSMLQRLLPGLALMLTIGVVLASDRIPNLIAGITILVGGALFHLIGQWASTLDRLESDGWLIGPFPEGHGWKPITPGDLAAADWNALAGQALPIAAVVAVSITGVLLNLSSLEAIVDQEISTDDEVRITGLANLAVAVGGGLAGWHMLGSTAIADRIGARGRSVPVAIGVGFLLAFFFGARAIELVPRSIAGGALAGAGLNLLIGWARSTVPNLNRGDKLMSSAILVAMAVLGVLPGVAFGLGLAGLVFIQRASRVNPARHVLAATGRSNVDRSTAERQLLVARRQSIIAIELQGFLFFGSATGLRSMLEDAGVTAAGNVTPVEAARPDAPRFAVIDMGRVTGIDSTAASSLARLVDDLADEGTRTVFSAVADDIAAELRRNGVPLGHRHQDLDHAIAYCEDLLLEDARRNGRLQSHGPFVGDLSPRFDQLTTTRRVAAGETLIAQGSKGRDLYFVESGRLTTWVTGPYDKPRRLRRVLPGAVLGEIGFVRGGQRSADVIADTDTVVLVVTRTDFEQLTKSEPDLAIAFQQLVLERLANRLATTSAMVRDLLD